MRLSFIPAQFIKVCIATRSDLSQFVVGGIHVVNNVGTARLWKVNSDFTDGGEIIFPRGSGKDDTVAAAIERDGSVLVVVCEAAPGGGGATSQPDAQRIPNVFLPSPAVVGGGSFVPAPGGYIRIKSVTKNDAPFNGQETVGLASFGIPAGISLLNIKLTAASSTIGARGRVGPHTDGSGAAMLFEQIQVVGNRMSGFLQTAPGPNHSLVLWADAGALTEFYVDVLGWWY